jgi:predicted dehydrogenase
MNHKLGIIGYGGMGHLHHHFSPMVDGLDVVAAYDIDRSRVNLAENLGLRPYFKLEDILNDSDVDIILVATPNDSHKELSIAALQAGKHVICEKPVTTNSNDLKEIIKVAKKAQRQFSVHQNRRWDKDFLTVKKVLDEGVIGKPFYVESRVQGSRGIPGDWRRIKASGGGMMFDWGVHLLDQMMSMINSPVMEVYAHIFNVNYPEVDDNLKIMLKFDNNISALLEVDTFCLINLPRWQILGSEGTMQLKNWECEGQILLGSVQEVDWNEISQTAAGPTRTMAPIKPEMIKEIPIPVVNSDIGAFYVNYLSALEGREELIVKPEQALRVLRVIEAAFLSSTKGVCVKGPF